MRNHHGLTRFDEGLSFAACRVAEGFAMGWGRLTVKRGVWISLILRLDVTRLLKSSESRTVTRPLPRHGISAASLCARIAAVVVVATPWSAACLADDIVRVISIEPALSAMRNSSLSGVVASKRNKRSPPKILSADELMEGVYLGRMMDQRAEAGSALRRSGWSAALVWDGWSETWKTMPDGVRADAVPLFVALKFAFEKCNDELGESGGFAETENQCMRKVLGPITPANDDCDDDKFCVYKLLSSDYENALFAHPDAPLSVQLDAYRQRPVVDTDLDRLAEKLTSILESIRASLPAEAAPCAKSPVKVLVDDNQSAEAGINVVAGFCARQLHVPIRIIEDIWARALFRATRNHAIFHSDIYRMSGTESGAGGGNEVRVRRVSVAGPSVDTENIAVTSSQGKASKSLGADARYAYEEFKLSGVYSGSVQSYVDLLFGLPAFEYPTILAGDLSREIRETGDAALIKKWAFFLNELETSDRHTHIEDFEVDSEVLRSLFTDLRESKPKTRRDKSLQRYLMWREGAERLDEKSWATYSGFIFELAELTQRTEVEFFKGLVFVLGHESWHLWMSNLQGKISRCQQEELSADAHAVRMFLSVAPKQMNIIPVFDEMESMGPFSVESGRDLGDTPLADLFADVLGRDPDIILKELYSGTRYEQMFCHPPLDERVTSIRARIEEGRDGLSRSAIDEMRSVLKVEADSLGSLHKKIVSGVEENVND